MASVKRFTAASAARRGVKAEFELEWQSDDNEQHIETFYCFPGRAPGAVLFDLIAISQESASMWEFYTAVMEDFDAFYKFVRSPGHGVTAEVLRGITSWIIEYDTGTPTLPSAS